MASRQGIMEVEGHIKFRQRDKMGQTAETGVGVGRMGNDDKQTVLVVKELGREAAPEVEG